MTQPDRKTKIVKHTDLEVYKKAFEAAMQIFHFSSEFPTDERFSLTDQIRRSSRSVAANIAEGWRRRRYSAAFVNKLNESEAEAAETQAWLQFAVECGYLSAEQTRPIYQTYDSLIAMLLKMQNHPENWILSPTS